MYKSALILLTLLILSCTPKQKVNTALEQIRLIDQAVQRFDENLHKLSSETFNSQKEFDSTIVRENFSSFTCFKKVDPQVSCIELGKQDAAYESLRFYYDSQYLILAIFYKEVNWKMSESGRQYFRNDSLLYTKSSIPLPDFHITLKVADSIRSECVLKLQP